MAFSAEDILTEFIEATRLAYYGKSQCDPDSRIIRVAERSRLRAAAWLAIPENRARKAQYMKMYYARPTVAESMKRYQREWRLKNPERKHATQLEWSRKNREYLNAKNRARADRLRESAGKVKRPFVTADRARRIIELRSAGATYEQINKETGASNGSIANVIKGRKFGLR